MKTYLCKISAIALMVAGSFYSCQKNEFDNGLLKMGAITEIKLGETAKNPKYGLSIRVDSISDGRCPIGLWCVWRGSAYVQFYLTTKEREYDFSFADNGRGMVIEGIKYQLMDVLPYPVEGEQQPEKTVKILVSEHSILADTQWKVIRYQNKDPKMPTFATYNLNMPYIIHFKNDFTVECITVCRFHQGTYIAGNDGSIRFDEISEADYQNCEFAYQWEIWVYNSLRCASAYTMIGNQLILEGPPVAPLTLYLEKI